MGKPTIFLSSKRINEEVFKDYLDKAKGANRISFVSNNPKEVSKKLELAQGDTLLNAGAALFIDSMTNELQMAKFVNDERLTFHDVRRYSSPIITLVDKAMAYLIDAMDWRVAFSGKIERGEIPEIPLDALRGAIVNAFAHCLIESKNPVEVVVFKSFIEVNSYGKFPDGISPE